MISFHPIILSNYVEVHDWLSRFKELSEYRQNNAWNKVKKQLKEPTIESAALQYYVLFPAHFAKVTYAIDQIIGQDRLAEWLKYNSQITVVDVGCGAGSASISFVNCLLNLYESKQIQHPISIHFVGIDPNKYAIALYNQQIKRLKAKIKPFEIDITHKLINKDHSSATIQLREELTKQRDFWGIPFLTHTFLFQANVVSPFSILYHETRIESLEMKKLGILSEELSDSQDMFGKEEATAYKQILENDSIDNLHIITVGTDGYEQRVAELAQAIDDEFQGNNHVVKRLGDGEHSVTYEIPDGCYWKEYKGNTQWTVNFCVAVSSLSNIALADEDWREIQSIQNLQSAWARARHHLLGQTLVDEVEIRLFESKLDANLVRLQQQLTVYAKNLVHTDDRLHFKFPKSNEKSRPLGLSRIEEEILSTALIQKLGHRISGITSGSYAYKFSRTYGNQSTEYLYENWFDAYNKYIEDARSAAQSNEGCVVIQTDIKSFYTRIIRDNLIQLSTEELSRSPRIEWLLRILFLQNINEHEAGKGIVQGNIASGFFANLYLVDLDARFGSNNEWNAKFFRYVDDMIIIVPDPDNVEEILATLEQELVNIGLELNRDKTECFTNVLEFIRITDKDKTLDNLQNQFQSWVNCLWILDDQHRQIFRKAYNESQAEWWYRIELYRTCLLSIGVHIDAPIISRRIYKYLFNDKLCEKDLTWQQPLKVPSLPDSMNENQIHGWKIKFEAINGLWIKEKTLLSDTFRELLSKSHPGLKDAKSEKRWTRTFRFCINKLVQIGFHHDSVAQIAVNALIESPWLIRNPHKITESIAFHEYTDYIESLLLYYADETDEMKEYMKSITLRAIRFFPHVSNSLWQQVTESAVSSSDVTSLMATETWLKITQNQPKLVQKTHLRQIEHALNKDPKPILRLRKNYMLILGEHGKEIIMQEDVEQDSLLKNVREIIQTNNIDSLFDYHEPEMLTREFYSGYRSDDDYHPSSS